jgi:hypothetical protein
MKINENGSILRLDRIKKKCLVTLIVLSKIEENLAILHGSGFILRFKLADRKRDFPLS